MTTSAKHKEDSLFDSVFNKLFNDEFITRPYMDTTKVSNQVLNRDEDWQIVFAIPGVKKNQVKIKVEDFVLSVIYDNKISAGKFNFVSPFNRSWNLESDVDVDKITANHEDGILTIIVPKPETKKRVVRIIEVG